MTPEAPIIGIVRHRINIDGDGVCTLVAFHTCPLRCKYCLNPQSLVNPQRFKSYTPQSLYDEVLIDQLYFLATNGGVTFGGGEPALRPEFIKAFRELCGDAWQIALETSLNVPSANIESLLPIVNRFFVDIKDMNPKIYRDYTGKDNALVISNLQLIAEQNRCNDVTVRVPLIPEFNTPQDQENSIRALKEMGFLKHDLFTYSTDINKT